MPFIRKVRILFKIRLIFPSVTGPNEVEHPFVVQVWFTLQRKKQTKSKRVSNNNPLNNRNILPLCYFYVVYSYLKPNTLYINLKFSLKPRANRHNVVGPQLLTLLVVTFCLLFHALLYIVACYRSVAQQC